MTGAMTGSWGALANLGYKVCDQTVGNVLHRHALPPRTENVRSSKRARKDPSCAIRRKLIAARLLIIARSTVTSAA